MIPAKPSLAGSGEGRGLGFSVGLGGGGEGEAGSPGVAEGDGKAPAPDPPSKGSSLHTSTPPTAIASAATSAAKGTWGPTAWRPRRAIGRILPADPDQTGRSDQTGPFDAGYEPSTFSIEVWMRTSSSASATFGSSADPSRSM